MKVAGAFLMRWVWLLMACLSLTVPQSVQAQRADVTPVLLVSAGNGEPFPAVNLQLRAAPVNTLTLDGLTVLEDGVPVPLNRLTLQPAEEQPIGLVLAVDVSMPADEFDRLRQQLKTVLAQLRPNDQVSVLAFNEKINTAISALSASNIGKAQAALDGLVAGGSFTALNAAIAAGVKEAQQLKTAPGHRALLVFTDSGENTNVQNADEIVQAALKTHVPVYLFGFALGKARPVGSDIPTRTAGQSFVSTGIDEAVGNLPDVLRGLRQSNLLRYASALKADGQSHSIKILWAQGSVVAGEQSFVAKHGDVQVSITGLPKSQWLAGSLPLGADAQAPAPIQRVDFLLDWQVIGSATQAPYRIDWDTRDLQPGEHTLTVRVTDQAGNVGTRETKVQAPPLTQLQLNLSSSWIWASNAAHVQADIDAVVPISRVELLIDGHVIDVHSEAPYLFDIPARFVQGGNRTIGIRAQDALGRISESSTVLTVIGIPWRYIVSPLMALLALVLGGYFIRQMFMAWRNGQVRTYPLHVQNTGNAPSRYLLRMVGQRQPQTLRLKLTHNGGSLPLAHIALEQPVPIMDEADEDAALESDAATVDVNTAQAQGKAALAKGTAAVAGASTGAKKLGTMATIATELFLMLGSWLPGGVGDRFKEMGGRIQQAQSKVKRANNAVASVKKVASSTVEKTAAIASTATGAAGKAGKAAGVPQPAIAMAASAASPRQRTSPVVSTVAPAVEPSSPIEILPAVAAHARTGRDGRWSITPLIAPGESLALGLVAQPHRPQLNRTLLYTLVLETRSAEDESGRDALSSNFTLEMKASRGWARYQPFVLAFAIGASMLIVAGWFLWIGGLLK